VRAFVVTATFAAIVAILLGVLSPVDVVRFYLLALLALAGAVVASRTLARFGRLERMARRPSAVADDTETPAFFERAKRRVELADTSAVYFEQLRPRLREIADQRLAAAHGLRLRSDEARQVLGEDEWLVLERPPQGDKFAPPPEGELARVIGALERI
jgi:hypothetical protein